ncbi:MAG: hypothetical protein Q7J00_04380 [Synergistaceae bacterium]|nr:hypothetical protein [Synergistaceae bacterium]
MINDRKLYEVHISMFDGWDLGIGIEIVPLPKEQRSPARTHAVRYVASERMHTLEGVLARETPDGFIWEWKTEKEIPASRITFKVCTLRRFNEYWKSKVPQNLDIRYEEDLHEWFRKHYLYD